MVFKFRIISDENKDFARELLISSENSFLDFHHCLQEDLGYDPKQLAYFFLTNAAWEKQLQITLLDMMDEEGGNCTTMDQVTLGAHFAKKGQRLLYVYDFFSERSFFIELTEVLDVDKHKTLPTIIFSHGEPPPQIDLGLENLDFDAGSFDELDEGDPIDDGFPGDFESLDADDYPDV